MSSGGASTIYTHCGLRVRSALELALPVAPGDEWDVTVRPGADIDDAREAPPGDVIAIFPTPEFNWYTATTTESGFLMRFHDCCEFVISADLRDVVVRSARTERSGIISVLIAGTLVAFLLALRGETVLHASAVAVDDAVIAFTGPSGRGKTTVAALMCVEGGARLVTDDLLVVDPGPPATCLGGATELRLRQAAAPIIGSRPEFTVRDTFDERLAFAPPAAALEQHRLAAIVIPAPSRTATMLGIERMAPTAALTAILSAPRVLGWSDPTVLSRDFSVVSRLVAEVPVYQATIPWGPPFAPSIASSLAGIAAKGRHA